jgi:regulator of replication initiation timing
MSEELQTIADRIGKKSVAIDGEKKKVVNLEGQIALYTRSKEKLEASIAEKAAEVELLLDIQNEVKPLITERDRLSAEMEKLRVHYDQYEWRADMPFEEKLESSAYPGLRDEKFRIIGEIDRLVKQANKIYYRR